MENHISAQLILFGQSVLLGLAGGFAYDLLRAFRLRRMTLTWLWDLLYCLGSATAAFLFLLRCGEGQFRLYTLVGAAGGGVLYFGLLAGWFSAIWGFWAENLACFLRLLALPVRWFIIFCTIFRKIFKNLFYFMKKCYTMRKIAAVPTGRHFTEGAENVAKRAKKKTKKLGSGFLTKLLLFALAGALGWQLYGLRGKMQSAKAQQTQLTQQIEAKQQENEALKDSIKKSGSKEEMEKIARDKLGLASPGEKVFYDTSN